MASVKNQTLTPYWFRTVHIGFQATTVIVFALGPLLFMSHDGIPLIPFVGLCTAAFLGAIVTLKAPWERMFATGTAMRWLYVWSIGDIAIITTFIAIAGPTRPDYFILYIFTTIFFTATYPRRGQILLFAFTAVAYLTAWGLFGEGEPLSRALYRVVALGVIAFMASFLAGELMEQMEAHSQAREDADRQASELRRSRAELEREKVFHESLVQAQSDLDEGVCIVDLETQRFEFVNDAFCSMHGYTRVELMGLPSFFQLFAPEEEQRFAPKVEARLKGLRTSDHNEVTAVRKDGTRFRVETAHKPLEGTKLVVLVRDVTERWEWERGMERSLSLLQATLESTADGILVVDAEGRISAFNEAFVEMWRLPREVVDAGDDERALQVVLGQLKDPDDFLQKVRNLYVSDEQSFDMLEFKDGRTFERYSQPQRLGGEIVGRVWSFRDVTSRRVADRAIERANAALVRADREKRRLLTHLVSAKEEERKRVASDIHDDSIQVMTSVVIGLERLARQTGDPDRKKIINRLEDAARGAVARLRTMVFELRPPTLDEEGLGTALRLHLEEFQLDTGINYVFHNELSEEPPVSYRTVLYRIAQEALTNVRKHARASSVTVSLKETDSGICLCIEDDGIGLQTMDATTLRHIGIPEMRERAEISGGRLEVRSTPGRGTTVDVWMPEPETALAGAPSDSSVV